MKVKRIVVGAGGILVAAGAACLALFSFGFFASGMDFRPVPAGHQEIIFLAPATSGEQWERLIAAVDVLQRQSQEATDGYPRLHVSKERAFTALTADVPEVSLWPDGCEDAKLWVRWCKLSADSNSEKWISRLTQQPAPPLAVVGGDNSFRALRVAAALERHRGQWPGSPPLLFFTTATADRFVPNNTPNVSTTDEKWPKLLDVYKGRSFRFSFTNSRMAAAVLGFVRSQNDLWPKSARPAEVSLASAVALVAAPDPLAGGALATLVDDLPTVYLYTLSWDDDSFSADLADRFRLDFLEEFARPRVSPYPIEYSVGDFYQPNPREAFVVGQLLPALTAARDHRQLMLLPADAERARRFLHTVVRRSAPADLKNLLVLTGDSLSFNTIFRDRNVAWNIQDLPVPLVTFSHRNPVAEDAGFKESKGAAVASATGTEDLLLYRDILEALLFTAYQGQKLTVSSDEVARGLHELTWANGRVRPGGSSMAAKQRTLGEAETAPTLLFQANDGNRNDGTGEHIIVLRPDPDDHGILAQATITVWRLEGGAGQRAAWQKVRTLTVTYDSLD